MDRLGKWFRLRLVGELGDLIEAVVDCLALGEAREEAPGDDLAAVGAGAAELAVLVVGFVVPFEGPLDVSFELIPSGVHRRGLYGMVGWKNDVIAGYQAGSWHTAMH